MDILSENKMDILSENKMDILSENKMDILSEKKMAILSAEEKNKVSCSWDLPHLAKKKFKLWFSLPSMEQLSNSRPLVAHLLQLPLLLLNLSLLVLFSLTYTVRIGLQFFGLVEKRKYREKRMTVRPKRKSEPKKRVCVVGVGSSGLICVKECIENGMDVVAYEKCSSLGGAFNPGYEGGKFTSSNFVTAFSCFPCTGKDLPMHHWSFDEYLEYLAEFVKHFDIGDNLRYNHEVIEAKQEDDGKWMVTVRDNSAMDEHTSVFDKIIVCSGSNHVPHVPQVEGDHLFEGDSCHSSQYRSAKPFQGKKVLLVGMGESGSDIAYSISKVAKSLQIITRKGPGAVIARRKHGKVIDIDTTRAYHGLPKTFMKFEGLGIPLWHKLKTWIESLNNNEEDDALDVAIANVKFTKYHWMSRYGTKSENFIRAVKEHGATYKETNILEMGAKSVKMADGSTYECDAIVWCSGFATNFSFLPSEFRKLQYRNDLWKKTFHPKFGTGIAFVGFARPNVGSIPPIAELQARFTALALAERVSLPLSDEMESVMKIDREYEEWLFPWDYERVQSLCSYMETLMDWSRLLGCDIDLARLVRNPSIAGRVIFGPLIPAQFRLFGPGSDFDGSMEALTLADSIPFVQKQFLFSLMLAIGTLSNFGLADPPIGLFLS
eukprot:GFUD01013740.1.p1 GENE.GFUD01013740.1~~GFUD01013740.1.p1  ORF type:complete len:660 (-),score=204.50 GFUD01013740.1:210-2189(-)